MVQDVAAAAPGEVYAAGGRFILEYHGSSWSATELPILPLFTFQSVSAPAAGAVWAVAYDEREGEDSTVLRLSGGDWDEVDLPSISGQPCWKDVHMTSTSQGWLVGRNNWMGYGLILSYDGADWVEDTVPTLGMNWWGLAAAHGLDPNHALAVGEGEDGNTSEGVILYWNGSDWTDQAAPAVSRDWRLQRVVSIQAGATVISWAVGENKDNGSGVMLSSENYSGVWSEVSLPARTGMWGLQGIDVFSPTLGFAVGYEFNGNTISAVVLQYDGANWNDAPITPALSSQWALFSVEIVSPTEAYAGGIDLVNRQSVIMRWNGSTWTAQAMPAAEQWYATGAVSFPVSGSGWAVGTNIDLDQGVILQYSGGVWSHTPSPLSRSFWSLTDVSFPGPSWGVAVGEDHFMNRRGIALIYNSGTWSEDPGLPDLGWAEWGLAAASFPSSTQGWAVGTVNGDSTNGLILQYNSGTWSRDFPPYIGDEWELNDVHFISASEGWAVGRDDWSNMGIILHYSGGVWTEITPGGGLTNNIELTAVQFADANNGWVGGYSYFNCQGVILSYHSGVWAADTIPPEGATCSQVQALSATAANRSWAVGYNEDPDHRVWYNNGAFWGPSPTPRLDSDNGLGGLDMISESEGWAVGWQFDRDLPRTKALILRYSD